VCDGFSGTLDEYASFVVDFCRTLELHNLVMYVNDSSGCIGIAAATRLPTGVVRGLVVADTVPIPLTGAAWLVGVLLRYVICSWLVRALNRRWNLLPWLVVTVAPWLRPLSRTQRAILTREFESLEKRERVLDLFEHMARDNGFMTTTANLAKERLGSLPTLVLFGQFDPMRLIGGAHRFQAMFSNSDRYPTLLERIGIGASAQGGSPG
jgi:pimeloyl-ACP methyl ester carboxylesterase